ncbi:hypothetical protein FLONG3_10714 [Fusarium longipes]|uniref:Uncharacterized protein n=1 Tax=Fusarium longipes TaxID=694270 RepID=A0A395RL35_9HYPO|nr:hypothetical protein FLONG3_10714 [Fusarium longipes]
MSSTNSATTSQQGLKPWQRRALDSGRTPLPEGPGARPSLTTSAEVSNDQASSTPSAPSAGDGTNQSASQPGNTVGVRPYRYWPTSEIGRLIRLRRDGLSWSQIKDHFPDRSLNLSSKRTISEGEP